MFSLSSSLLFVLLCCWRGVLTQLITDVYIPENCSDNVTENPTPTQIKTHVPTAQSRDHILFAYQIVYLNGTIGPSVISPNQLSYTRIEESVSLTTDNYNF